MPVILREQKGSALTHAELDGHAVLTKALTIPTVVISAGVVTVPGAGTYKIDTEGAAATDDVHTILGTTNSERVRFRVVNAARTVRFQHNTSGGNVRMPQPAFILNSLCDYVEFENIEGTFLAWRAGASVADT